MKVAVIGLGYVGLPTAAVIASHGFEVFGVDTNQELVDKINRGHSTISEIELEKMVRLVVQSGHLTATTAVPEAEVFILAVPSPLNLKFKPDLSYIESAVMSIVPKLKKNDLVILESTSPVGTTEKITKLMQKERPDLSFPDTDLADKKVNISVAHCPERVLPGQAVRELAENDRIIGGITQDCTEKAKKFWENFAKGRCLGTDVRTAELSKLAENAFRDVNIAFANELSMICDQLGIDVWQTIQLANRHPRVDILKPGPGVGGHCIAVDPWFIVDSAPQYSKLIQTARIRNDSKPKFILDKIKKVLSDIDQSREKVKIATLGLTYKPDIDDLRESPALEIALQIEKIGLAHQYIVEPNVEQLPTLFNEKISSLVDLELALGLADVILVLVDHSQFRTQLNRFASKKPVLDTVGVHSSL